MILCPNVGGAGEPDAAPGGGRITGFQGSMSHQRPLRVSFCVRRKGDASPAEYADYGKATIPPALVYELERAPRC